MLTYVFLLSVFIETDHRTQLACIRAGIHIEYKDDESIPSSMGIKDIEYNEKDWKFYGINGLQSRLMYFA